MFRQGDALHILRCQKPSIVSTLGQFESIENAHHIRRDLDWPDFDVNHKF